MPSIVVSTTAVTSFIGFVINTVVMLVVLSRGRERHHLLFAPILFTAASWDLGIFLVMIRNGFPDEVLLYQTIVTLPFILFPAFVWHFTTTYLGHPRRISTISIYAYCVLALIALAATGGGVSGVHSYDWGNVVRYEANPVLLSFFIVFSLSLLSSCWLLFRARRREPSPIRRRHIGYILASFIVICVAQVKILVVMGVDAPLTLPVGMLMVDMVGALIGVAILKHRLFDITVIVRKGIIYSGLAALVVFIFSLSEHVVTTYVSEMVGESEYLHLISIAIVIVAFMPIRERLERRVGGYFTTKKVEF